MNASAQPASVAAPGGTGAIVVATNRECAWEARSEADWLSLSGANGQGDGTVPFAATANPQAAERRGTVVVNGVRVEITQGPAPCVYSLDRIERSIDANGGPIDVAVSVLGGCPWTAVSQVSWITVAGGGTGQGAGTVTLLVQENDAPARRTGTVTIAGRTYTVEQGEAATPIPIPPVDPTCTYTVAPLAGEFGPDGGAGEVIVTASSSRCAWAAASAVPWIRLEGAGDATGSGAIRYVVAPNPAGTARAGTLIVAGTVVTLTQAAAGAPAPAPCTFSIAPAITSFPAEGGASEVAVTASAPACAWTAQPAVAWIAIQGAGGGTGSGRLRFVVAANVDPSARSGALVVAGVTVAIAQAAPAPPPPPPPPPCTYAVAPAAASFADAGGTGEIVVTASAPACTWTAASGAPWLTIASGTSGTGSGRVTYTVAAHAAPADRTGTLTVAGQTVTITQAGVTPPPPCTYVVTPLELTVGLLGAVNLDVQVDTAATCAWTAVSQANWITINGAAAATGPGSIRITVGASLLTGRAGTLLVAGQTVTVTQTGLLGARENRE